MDRKRLVLTFIFFASLILLTCPAASRAAELKVTDSSGETPIIIRNVKVSYAGGPNPYSFNSSYSVNNGIRIKKGEGTLLVPWSKVRKLEITNYNDTKLIMTDGTEENVKLVPATKGGLKGLTDIGEFSINLDKVKVIEVIKP